MKLVADAARLKADEPAQPYHDRVLLRSRVPEERGRPLIGGESCERKQCESGDERENFPGVGLGEFADQIRFKELEYGGGMVGNGDAVRLIGVVEPGKDRTRDEAGERRGDGDHLPGLDVFPIEPAFLLKDRDERMAFADDEAIGCGKQALNMDVSLHGFAVGAENDEVDESCA